MTPKTLVLAVLCAAALSTFASSSASAADIVRPIEDVGRLSTAPHVVVRDAVRRSFEKGQADGVFRDESYFERSRLEDTVREDVDMCARGALDATATDLLVAVATGQPFNLHDTLQSALAGCLGRMYPGYERWVETTSAVIAGNWTAAALVAAHSYPTVGMFHAWLLNSAAGIR